MATAGATTARETRAATLVAWLQRLHDYDVAAVDATEHKTTLTVHLLGADHREGNTPSETIEVFRSFSRCLAVDTRFSTLQLVLVGPNLARTLHLQKHSQLCDAAGKTCQMELSYFVGGFEEYFADKALYLAPDLVACFNAGIWGYDEWLPAIRLVLKEVQVPLLVTSYNENEAGDDEDVLDDLAPARWLWRAEKNPSGARTPRATNNPAGEVLKENDYWMCVSGRPDATCSK
ncbi:hypothetical protein BBJ28_00023316 [Nothophytophthora sp. Chile5]|nr:hypothetical protein BBJ28_00023316 [Nothophytophthora sp. Chile5]